MLPKIVSGMFEEFDALRRTSSIAEDSNLQVSPTLYAVLPSHESVFVGFASEIMSPSSTLPYHVSSIHQRSYGLPIPTPFPALFRAVNREGFISFPSSTSSAQVPSILFPLPSPDDRTRADVRRDRERKQGTSRLFCDSVVGMTGNQPAP